MLFSHVKVIGIVQLVLQQFRYSHPTVQRLRSFSSHFHFGLQGLSPHWWKEASRGLHYFQSYLLMSAETTFASQCGSAAAIVYYTINCLHSSLLLQVLNLLRLPVRGRGCQLADREVLVLQLLEVINSLNCQKVTAGRKFLAWGHSWIPATCSLIYQ